MSNDPKETGDEPVSAEQRLELLEKGRKLDRILLFALAAVLVMTLVSWLTIALLSKPEVKQESISAGQIQGLQEQAAALQKQITALEQTSRQHGDQLGSLHSSKPVVTLAKGDNRAVQQQVAQTLIGQEQSFQLSLAALKNGMRDLAGMIAGSRSWLSDYQEALDKQMADSQARAKHLQKWVASPAAP
jgi:chromosome segregation ATPase